VTTVTPHMHMNKCVEDTTRRDKQRHCSTCMPLCGRIRGKRRSWFTRSEMPAQPTTCGRHHRPHTNSTTKKTNRVMMMIVHVTLLISRHRSSKGYKKEYVHLQHLLRMHAYSHVCSSPLQSFTGNKENKSTKREDRMRHFPPPFLPGA